MQQYIPYLYIFYTLVLIIASKFHIKQIDKKDVTRKWKRWEFINRCLVIGLLFLASGCRYWQDYLLSGAINIFFFEWGMNVIALNTSTIFYVGTTSKLENFLGKYKWHLSIGLIIISIILKVIT